MLILAFDTSATTASVALLEDGKSIASSHVYNRLTHSEKLLPMIDSLLSSVGKSIADVELICVSSGPGSFTGIRIGVSCAKGLSFSSSIPISPVSTLEALADNVRLFADFDKEEVLVCPCMDARRNELYNGVFSYDGKTVTRVTPDRAISCEALEAELLSLGKRVLLLGDGAEKMRAFLSDKKTDVKYEPVPIVMCMQNAESVGRVGYKYFLENKSVDAGGLTCTYLRQSQAERTFKEDK